TQTRRHSYLVNLLGVKNVVLAVNKMDLVDYSAERFYDIVADYSHFAKQIGMDSFLPIPISGLKGDNIVEKSANMPWYQGPTLLGHLEEAPVSDQQMLEHPFRMAVQWVNRPNLDFRGFAGQISAGVVRPGDAIRVLPSGKTTTVKSIVTYDGELEKAVAGQSITLTFADEIACSRGD